jgi:hypothetical protein
MRPELGRVLKGRYCVSLKETRDTLLLFPFFGSNFFNPFFGLPELPGKTGLLGTGLTFS